MYMYMYMYMYMHIHTLALWPPHGFTVTQMLQAPGNLGTADSYEDGH